MKCPYCAEEISEGSSYCQYCGKPAKEPEQTYMQSVRQSVTSSSYYYEPPIRKVLGAAASVVLMLSLIIPIIMLFITIGELPKLFEAMDRANEIGLGIEEVLPAGYIFGLLVYFVGAIITIVMTVQGIKFFVRAVKNYNQNYSYNQNCAFAVMRFAIGDIAFMAGMILMLLLSGKAEEVKYILVRPSLVWIIAVVVVGGFIAVHFLNKFAYEEYNHAKQQSVRSAAPAPSANGIWVCSCGAKNRISDSFCNQCGKNR